MLRGGHLRGRDLARGPLRAPDLARLQGPVPGARLRAPDLARLRGPGLAHLRGPGSGLFTGAQRFNLQWEAISSQKSLPSRSTTGAVSERLNSLSDIYILQR